MIDNRKLIEALETERRGYLARNLHHRVAEVDAQLSRLGAIARRETTTAEPFEERAVAEQTKKRTTKKG